jgi:hypothetical protein
MENNVPEWLLNGKKWSEEEEQQLLDEIHEGISKTEMSKRHERSIGSIRAKIIKLAIKMYNSKLPLAEIASKTNLSEEVIIQKVNRRPAENNEEDVSVALPKREKKEKKSKKEKVEKADVKKMEKKNVDMLILDELIKLNKNMELLLKK